MKKTTILCSLAASLILASPLRAAEILSLPEPDKKGGMPLMQALTERKSSRDFIPGSTLTLQQTSDLLYAAFGVNRPNGNRTAPTALNFQDITVYICQADNVCKYDAANHQLIKIADGDYRKDCGMQKEMHQNAAAVLIFVSETEKITRGTDEQKKIYGAMHAGAISQNVYLYAASAGLGSVVCGSLEAENIRTFLNLPTQHTPVLIQPVGPVKK